MNPQNARSTFCIANGRLIILASLLHRVCPSRSLNFSANSRLA